MRSKKNPGNPKSDCFTKSKWHQNEENQSLDEIEIQFLLNFNY